MDSRTTFNPVKMDSTLNRVVRGPKQTLSVAKVVPITGGASLNLSNPMPKVREAAPTVFTQRPPQQEKLNGGS